MQVTKMGHACVRLEHDGVTLVIDPGSYSVPEALDGAHAVLITHEHADHFVAQRLHAAAENNLELRIWANGTVAGVLSSMGQRVTAVQHGDRFSVGGFDVLAVGERHAIVHPDVPQVPNVGFVVDGRVFHPGDAL